MITISSSSDPTSATAGHAATAAPTASWPGPCATLAAGVAAMPTPSSHRAIDGTGTFRRAESSINIELGQISPSTVKRHQPARRGVGCD